jgi:hypothetical protein
MDARSIAQNGPEAKPAIAVAQEFVDIAERVVNGTLSKRQARTATRELLRELIRQTREATDE